MAPEIHSGGPFKGVNADNFALAVILFQMVIGQPPFEEASQEDFLYKCLIAKRPDIFWRQHSKSMAKNLNVSDELKDLLVQMLTANPSHRPSLEEIMAHKWVVDGPETTSQELTATFNQRLAIIHAN